MSFTRVRWLIDKEFRQLRRDKLLIRIAILLPLVQLILLGYVVSADVDHLPTAVVDLDGTSVSQDLSASLQSSGYFDVTQRVGSTAELTELFDTGTVSVALIIPEGTQRLLTNGDNAPVTIIVDGTDNASASVGSGYAVQVVEHFNEQQRQNRGIDLDNAPGVDARVQVQFNPSLSTINTMIPALMAVLMMVSMSVIMSQSVVKERESGSLEQLFVTPLRPAEYVVGKVVAYVAVAIAQTLVVAIVGMTWFRVPFHGSVPVVVVGLGLFMLISVGIGLLISVVSTTRAQAQQSVLLITIPSMILSGFIFPLASMPAPFQVLSNFIPLTHILTVMRGAFVKGVGFAELAEPLWWLAGFAVACFGAAIVATHKRISS